VWEENLQESLIIVLNDYHLSSRTDLWSWKHDQIELYFVRPACSVLYGGSPNKDINVIMEANVWNSLARWRWSPFLGNFPYIGFWHVRTSSSARWLLILVAPLMCFVVLRWSRMLTCLLPLISSFLCCIISLGG